jgi:D-lactate dehydrogenase (cytochrome)
LRLQVTPRRPSAAPLPVTDAARLQQVLEDAAHTPDGSALGVVTPADEAGVADVLRSAARVLPIGAQSSLTGGATPRGDVVLSTSGMRRIRECRDDIVRVEAGVTLDDLQAALAARGAAYPPAPTWLGATVGGIIATNAAGAATFKYGTTRDWVRGLTVVLATGDVLDLERGQVRAEQGRFEIDASAAGLSCRCPPTACRTCRSCLPGTTPRPAWTSSTSSSDARARWAS